MTVRQRSGPKTRAEKARQAELLERLADSSETKKLGPPPADLGTYGKQVWKIVRQVAWITSADHGLCYQLASATQQAQEMRDDIKARGMVISEAHISASGVVVGEKLHAHPLLSPLRRLSTEIIGLQTALALSPQEKLKLGAISLEEPETTAVADQLTLYRQAAAKTSPAR